MKKTIHFRYNGFYDLLVDALYQYRLAQKCTDSYSINRHARASISASMLTLECCANCLISSLTISSALLKDIDKLPVVAKFETYLKFRGIKTFNRGEKEIQKVAELIRIRNDYVHLKVLNINADLGQFKDQGQFAALPVDLHGDIWEGVGIPKRALFWSTDNALSVLEAVRSFFVHVFIDLMKSDASEIRFLLFSRLETTNTQTPNIFNEFEYEIKKAADHGIDFMFLGLNNV